LHIKNIFAVGARWSGKSPARLQPSNSGEALKLWLPRNGTICKWINNPLAVTISMMMETEIGNRGSKLIIGMPIHTFVIILMEQRVDGSWWEKFSNTRPKINQGFSHLRCILMGFERNYQVSSLSKQRHTYRGYSTSNKKVVLRSSLENFKLYPWWVTGFVDGEGCFHVEVRKNLSSKLGWVVVPRFSITLHEKDKAELEAVIKSLGVGKISRHGPNTIKLQVHSLKELVLPPPLGRVEGRRTCGAP